MNEPISGFAGLFAQFIRKAQRSIRTFVVYVCSPGSDASRCSQSCERSAASSGALAQAQKRPAAGGHINKWTVGTFPFSLM